VRSQVLVSLLVTGVLGDEVKVFSADDEGSVHLGGNDGAGQDTATDGDKTSEWALLVYWGKKKGAERRDVVMWEIHGFRGPGWIVIVRKEEASNFRI
jgi:hypothetical protein